MAFSCCSMLLFLLCSLLCLSSSLAKTRTSPKQVFLPIYKDPSTLQYVTPIKQRTPLVPIRLVLDLGGRALWAICETGYNSTTFRPAGCNTTQCRLAEASQHCLTCSWGPFGPGCTNTPTCWRFPMNSVTRLNAPSEMASDIIAINSVDRKGRQGKAVTVPRFLFICAPTLNVGGLAKGVVGMAGLGRSKISFPAQLASALNLKRRFGLCLSSSTRSKSGGVVIFGDGPYKLNDNSSSLLKYTSLTVNKVNTEDRVLPTETSAEYFIGVKSIKINNKTVNLNTTLLKINDMGFGGTKISTVHPYTLLETSIYKAVIKAFVNEVKNVTRVQAVAPFGACFSSNKIGTTGVGPAVPTIDLVMKNGVVWRMYGANTVVRVNKNVLCLGFVDGGEPTYITSIVIGGHQLEDNLLTFDLDKSRLGFSSSLLSRQTTCADYRPKQ
ncbi:Hepatoma-derived growth factor-related protein [Heracleum sosnowskyi]|uniref:Hepatoma-derived growth factor-related protein n=1 Tax=Heracleum sosnowskyi TaxID=360622 RepID=A0AAD8J1C0_9APIA|nr:Hepatoma-derived growth factor-related protein [Heracleum sosnowskyi]